MPIGVAVPSSNCGRKTRFTSWSRRKRCQTRHRELEARVSRAYEKFVAPGQDSFTSQGAARRLGDVVKFKWEMVSASGDVAGGGLEFVIVDADGRIRLDYQFIE
jgi:hypothetical protein